MSELKARHVDDVEIPSATRAGQAVVRVGQGQTVAPARKPAASLAEARTPGAEIRPAAFDAPQPPWAATGQYAQALLATRRRRSRRMLAWFAAVVLLPTLASAGYFAFVATPRYTSQFEFTYQTYRGASSLASGLVQSVTGTSQQNTIDLGTIVSEYIRSPALAEKLDAELGLRRAFGDETVDWLSRLSHDSSRENFYAYLRSHIKVSQGLGGYIGVDVSTFDRDFSLKVAKAVVVACDAMVDDLTSRARQNQISYAQAELSRQEDRVRAARLALTRFQNRQGDQDPARAASQLGTIVGSIETDLSAARTQLSTASVSLSPGSPIIVQLKQKVASLQDQLKQEQARLAVDKPAADKTAAAGGGAPPDQAGGPVARQPYSEVLENYASLQVEDEFAKSAYMAAQQGLVVARADAAAKQNYLIDFAPPSFPDRLDYSYPLEVIASVLLVALLVFGFGSVAAGAARDQIAG